MSALVVTLLLAAPLSGEEIAAQAESEFDLGLIARQRGEKSRPHFLAAARAYEELRARGARNVSLERNIGNSYLLAGDLPRAILAYRRGQRLAPDSPGLRASLDEARKQVIFLEGSTLGRPPDDSRPAWLPHAPRSLFVTSTIFYIFFCLALTRWLMLRRGRWLMIALLALLAAAGITSLLVASHRAESASPVAVIAENGVLLRRGDGPSFPPRSEVPINRGVEAHLLHRQNGWLQIELSGGEVGWVAEGQAVVEE